MNASLPFWKMHGAGNDFILLDDRSRTFPADPAFIRTLCDRRRGIGAEGLILIRPPTSPDAAFRMDFYNPDGSPADMCGNGARCVARLAHDLSIAPPSMLFETAAGPVRAQILATPSVCLHLSPPKEERLHLSIVWKNRTFPLHALNTGVPHAILDVAEALPTLDVPALGAHIRHHPLFAPDGTNVDFIRITGPSSLDIRTYERGVEAETQACGTGVTAAALIAARLHLVTPPVRVHTAGGDTLIVTCDPCTPTAPPALTGPAEYVFHGTLPPAP